MKFLSPTRRNALLLIAATAISTWATAQFSLKTNTSAGGGASVVQTDQVRAELIAHAPQGVGPGQPLMVGLKITHQPHWHTYWKNAGDSGLPTTLQWTLPDGITAGETAWPAPKSIAIGTLTNYGYEDTVVLPVPLTVGPNFAPGLTGDLEVKLSASWLVCRQECIPQEGNFVLQVPVRGSVALNARDFNAAKAAAPSALVGTSQAEVRGNVVTLTVSGLPKAWRGQALQAFPEISNLFETSGTPNPTRLTAAMGADGGTGTGTDANANANAGAKGGSQAWRNDTWVGRFAVSDQRLANVSVLPAVLRWGDKTVALRAPVTGTWPALAVAPGVSPALQTALDANRSTALANTLSTTLPKTLPATSGGSWAALGLALAAALLGGLILNLMPCVLPVLAIKVMAVAQHAHQTQRVQRLQGLSYTVGVILSFVALGGLMLALRAGGEQLGWGFHLQSPAVVAGLAVLFTLLALNLAGLFEVGNLLPQGLANLQAKHPAADAFLSGVLAVAIASPCSAPFMGASLGYAITLPAVQALAIFAALGLGLALPFLAAAWVPAVATWLPRPGAWMDTLRRFMAFPMLATVVWLVWVLGHLSGVNGAGALLALLVTLALVVWSLGLVGRSRSVFASISIASAAMVTWAAAPFVLQMAPVVSATVPAAVSDPTSSISTTVSWQAWVPGRVEAALAAGKPVFVDFTAAWCITCQYNKKTTLTDTDVVADFAAKNVQLLRADWTRRDPAITQALEQLGRTGVPVYVLYQSGKAPVVFSEILDAQVLRKAIASL